MSTPEKNITYEIKAHLGVIKKHDTGWNRELNLVSWNGSPEKYDIRDWDSRHERMSRGITLHEDEMDTIVALYDTFHFSRENKMPAEGADLM